MAPSLCCHLVFLPFKLMRPLWGWKEKVVWPHWMGVGHRAFAVILTQEIKQRRPHPGCGLLQLISYFFSDTLVYWLKCSALISSQLHPSLNPYGVLASSTDLFKVAASYLGFLITCTSAPFVHTLPTQHWNDRLEFGELSLARNIDRGGVEFEGLVLCLCHYMIVQ